jgi:hypothetical protein
MMNETHSKRNRWLTLVECLTLAFLPMIGLGVGCLATRHGNYIVRSVYEGFVRSLAALDLAFYALPAILATMACDEVCDQALFFAFMASACLQSLAIGLLFWVFVGRRQLAARLLRWVGALTLVFLSAHILSGWSVYVGHAPARKACNAVEAADHSSLLAECRQLITEQNRPDTTNTHPRSASFSRSSPRDWDRLPPNVRELAWSWVDVEQDHVLVQLHGPPRHYLIGFAPDAKEFGTRKLFPGLWYWNGSDTNRNTGQQSGGGDGIPPSQP